MDTLAQALASLETWRGERAAQRTTGFPGLDEATGGFEAGHVWIVIGTPGQGRSALGSQWALLLATEHRLGTQLVSTKDPLTRVAARLTSCGARVPLSHLWHTGLSEDDKGRINRQRSALDSAHLTLVGPREVTIGDTDMDDLVEPDALVVDDAHLSGGLFPKRVASVAARGILTVLTLPRDGVISGAGIDPQWADVADFILDVDRPDLIDHTSLRPGEADLHLLRNRWGPTRTETVVFQDHYARFVSMDSQGRRPKSTQSG
jgi:replicative DNA helicase